MNDLTTMVGFLAGLATTAANLPQVWKNYRNKSAEGLSFRMLLTLAIGVGLLIIYGFLSKSLPLIVTNAVVLLLILSLLGIGSNPGHEALSVTSCRKACLCSPGRT